jgi:hypothetical protein
MEYTTLLMVGPLDTKSFLFAVGQKPGNSGTSQPRFSGRDHRRDLASQLHAVCYCVAVVFFANHTLEYIKKATEEQQIF